MPTESVVLQLHNKDTQAFRNTQLQPTETMEAWFEGWIGDMMGDGANAVCNGTLILTDTRILFYKKGRLVEQSRAIPLREIVSVNRRSKLGYLSLEIRSLDSRIVFKTFQIANNFEFFMSRFDELRRSSNTNEQTLASQKSADRAAEKEVCGQGNCVLSNVWSRGHDQRDLLLCMRNAIGPCRKNGRGGVSEPNSIGYSR